MTLNPKQVVVKGLFARDDLGQATNAWLVPRETWRSWSRSKYAGQGSRVYLSPGKAKRIEPVQAQDVKTERGPHQCPEYLQEVQECAVRMDQALLDGAQHQDRRQGAEEVPPAYEEEFSVQVTPHWNTAQRGCGISLPGYPQELSEHIP